MRAFRFRDLGLVREWTADINAFRELARKRSEGGIKNVYECLLR